MKVTDRKVTVSFTVGLGQLDRMTEEARRAGVNRSELLREAIDRELERRAKNKQPDVDNGGRGVEDAVVVAETARRT
jgi:metal-responsive CopG/Arc/MetJ family transcriptional regulator